MSENDATRISIRLDGCDPMRGTVEPGGADAPQSFVGWLGLLKALEDSVTALPVTQTTVT